MASRDASCSCGQLRLEATGDPLQISMCHCLACQRRTGSAFGIQARFMPDQVDVTTSVDADVWVPVGGFADPSFPPPNVSIYESRRHSWVAVPDAIERHDD